MNQDSPAAREIAEAVSRQIQGILAPLSHIAGSLDKSSRRLDEIDKRVMLLEATHMRPEIERLERAIESLEKQVDALNTWRHQVNGAMTLFNWVRSSWPFFVALGGTILAYIQFGDPGK